MRLLRIHQLVFAASLIAFACAAPVALAQTKAHKSTAKHTTQSKAKHKTKAKPKAKAKPKSTRAKVTQANVKPKMRTVVTGEFKPLRNDDRLTIIIPARPARASDLNMARNRNVVYTTRNITVAPNTYSQISAANYPSTALVVNSPQGTWWGNGGPATTSYYDPRYGWITVVGYSWGNVMYTYGYQVVNYWNGNGYSWVAYNGVPGMAYPVIYQ